jgi:hypothetical protein
VSHGRAFWLASLLALPLACGEPSPAPPAAPADEVKPESEVPSRESGPIVVVPPAPAPAPVTPARPPAATAKPPVVASTAPVAPPPPEVVAPEMPPPAAAPPLDLEGLEHRLKQTKALGVLTKLALKNQIDDLIADLDAFHQKHEGDLAALRERFDLLLLKVTSLLQDGEPDLAREIAEARDGLWRLLADPTEFAKLSA